jgi:UDP-N-acetylglucosamine--N-acetylmuramyl-(pentapeptide) pyrophosphoryl-undecaprenol N-acetylglucosamine transferase
VVRKIAVTAGGTAGHIVAALEFLKAYRSEFGAEGLFIGCGEPLEMRLAAARGVRVESVPGLPFARQTWKGKIAAASRIGGGVAAARRILEREGTQLVIGAGGYGSFNTCLAASLLRLPLIIHEANARPGTANRLLARLADRVCVGFPEAAGFAGRKTVLTGNPASIPRRRPLASCQPPRILVVGGSLGSPLLNREAPRLFAALRRRGIRFSLLHLAGIDNHAAVRHAYQAAAVSARVEEFSDRVSEIYAETDFAISGCGALTIADLAAAGVPSLFVPQSSVAHNHQVSNARAYGERTGAYWVEEDQWSSETMADWIARVIGDSARLEAMRRNALAWSRPHAARDLVRTCEELLDPAASNWRSCRIA